MQPDGEREPAGRSSVTSRVDGAGDAAKDLDTGEDKDLGRVFAEPGLATWRVDETGRFPLPQGFPTAEPSMLVPASSFATPVRPAPYGESSKYQPSCPTPPFRIFIHLPTHMSIHMPMSTRMPDAGFETPDYLEHSLRVGSGNPVPVVIAMVLYRLYAPAPH